MKISLNCRTVSNDVQNIEISTEVIKGSLEIDFCNMKMECVIIC